MASMKTRTSKFLLFLTALAVTALACQASFETSPEGLVVTLEALATQAGAPLDEGAATGQPAATPRPEVTPQPPLPSGDGGVQPPTELLTQQEAMIQLYERVSPGVVALLVGTSEGQTGSGSGFVIDKEGHIVTNLHVVEGATEVQVNFPSGIKVRGTVIGTDKDSDLAIVKVAVDPDDLIPLPLGDSGELKVGQIVIAIGNPFGLNGTMTTGIVSSLGRTLDSLNVSPTGGTFTAGDIIQTDAAINPGNSGGPLLNLNGEVVGVNRAIRTDALTADGSPANSGIGFAVSVNILKRVAPSLIANGFYEYPYLGVATLPELPLELMEQLGRERAFGALVTSVVPGSPAEAAGLRQGDLLLTIDTIEIRSFGDMIAYLFTQKAPGETVVFEVLRNGEEIEVPLVLGRRP